MEGTQAVGHILSMMRKLGVRWQRARLTSEQCTILTFLSPFLHAGVSIPLLRSGSQPVQSQLFFAHQSHDHLFLFSG
ncbi:MAG: hypothetical protein OEW04_06535, partial [Nitrospirota bacterium]|nr:hypothetical protein [Nitrospirota bacterium]